MVALYGMIHIGHLSDVMETTLMSRVDRWVLSLERLALDPLWGIGFADTAAEIGSTYGPHNSYISPLLNSGLIVGLLYLGALLYAFASEIRRRWTLWSSYIVGTVTGIFSYMAFESLFLGGLSTSSIVLGLFIGLMLISNPDPEPDEGSSPPESTTQARSTSRAGRLVDRIRAT